MNQQQLDEKQIVIIGAGPAGLTAAYELAKLDVSPIVIEKARQSRRPCPHGRLQGLSIRHGRASILYQSRRSQQDSGARYSAINFSAARACQESITTANFSTTRSSRSMPWPVSGFWQSILIMLSYHPMAASLPYPKEETFEQWVTNRFGKSACSKTIFQTYTEKVWGIPCSRAQSRMGGATD